MNRFYEKLEARVGDEIKLSPENSRIAKGVLRMRPEDPLEIVNGAGVVLSARLKELSKRQGVVEVVQRKINQRIKPEFLLLQGMPKGEKSSWIVQKCVEWGVANIVFLETEHAMAKKSKNQTDRWMRVAIEAIRQSGNPFLPQIDGPISVSEALTKYRAEGSYLFDESEKSTLLKDCPVLEEVQTICAAVGPEGGWSDSERILFRDAGYTPVSFGPYVLRTETAALSAVAALYGKTGFRWN